MGNEVVTNALYLQYAHPRIPQPIKITHLRQPPLAVAPRSLRRKRRFPLGGFPLQGGRV